MCLISRLGVTGPLVPKVSTRGMCRTRAKNVHLVRKRRMTLRNKKSGHITTSSFSSLLEEKICD